MSGHISYSSYTAMNYCPRFYQYKYLMNISQPESSALTLGRDFHLQMNKFLSFYFNEGKTPTVEDICSNIEDNISVGISNIVLNVVAPKMICFLEENKINNFVGETELNDEELGIKGIPDAVLSSESGKVYCFEYKTTRSYSSSVINNLYNSPQIILYNYLLRKNGIKNVTFIAWVINLKYIKIDYERIILGNRTKEEDILIKSLSDWKDMTEIFKSSGSFPQNLNNCINFYGTECPYYNYRTMNPVKVALINKNKEKGGL